MNNLEQILKTKPKLVENAIREIYEFSRLQINQVCIGFFAFAMSNVYFATYANTLKDGGFFGLLIIAAIDIGFALSCLAAYSILCGGIDELHKDFDRIEMMLSACTNDPTETVPREEVALLKRDFLIEDKTAFSWFHSFVYDRLFYRIGRKCRAQRHVLNCLPVDAYCGTYAVFTIASVITGFFWAISGVRAIIKIFIFLCIC